MPKTLSLVIVAVTALLGSALTSISPVQAADPVATFDQPFVYFTSLLPAASANEAPPTRAAQTFPSPNPLNRYVHTALTAQFTAYNLDKGAYNGRVASREMRLWACSPACTEASRKATVFDNPTFTPNMRWVESWSPENLVMGNFYRVSATLTFTNGAVLRSQGEVLGLSRDFLYLPYAPAVDLPTSSDLGATAGTVTAAKSNAKMSFGKWNNTDSRYLPGAERVVAAFDCSAPVTDADYVDTATVAGCTKITEQKTTNALIMTPAKSLTSVTTPSDGRYLVLVDEISQTNLGITVRYQKRSNYLAVAGGAPVDPNDPSLPPTPGTNTGGVQGGVAPAVPTPEAQDALSAAMIDLNVAPLAGNKGSGTLGGTTLKVKAPKKQARGKQKRPYTAVTTPKPASKGTIILAVTTGEADGAVVRTKSLTLKKSKAKVRWNFSKSFAAGPYIVYASFTPKNASAGTALTVSKAFRLK